jgi:hypothetical protein
MPPADAELKLALGSAGASPSRSLTTHMQFPELGRFEIPHGVTLRGIQKGRNF